MMKIAAIYAVIIIIKRNRTRSQNIDVLYNQLFFKDFSKLFKKVIAWDEQQLCNIIDSIDSFLNKENRKPDCSSIIFP